MKKGIAVAAIIAMALPAFAAENLKSARVTQIVNDVKLLTPQETRPAKIADRVAGEAAVQTGVQSRSELVFHDETVTRLGANTIFSFKEGTRDMELKRGTLLLQVPKKAGGATIRTAAVTAAITGTTVFWETGLGKFIKFIVAEGTARLYLNNKLGESILVPAGYMVILPANVKSLKGIEPVPINIKKLMATSKLIQGMKWIGPFSFELINKTIAKQTRGLKGDKLKHANLVIIGSGTELVIASNYNITAGHTLDLDSMPPRKHEEEDENGHHQPPPPPPPPGPPVFPGTFPIDDSTTGRTNPQIRTGNLVHSGGTYRSAALDGPPRTFFFDSENVPFVPSPHMDGPVAVFRFENLALTGSPAFATEGGANNLALISFGNITNGGAPARETIIEFFDTNYTLLASRDGSIVHPDPFGGENLHLFAGKDVRVGGVMGSIVQAGRNIVVADALQGSDGPADLVLAGRDIRVGSSLSASLVIAGRHVVTNQLEAGKVFAGGGIFADTIFAQNIFAGGPVEFTSFLSPLISDQPVTIVADSLGGGGFLAFGGQFPGNGGDLTLKLNRLTIGGGDVIDSPGFSLQAVALPGFISGIDLSGGGAFSTGPEPGTDGGRLKVIASGRVEIGGPIVALSGAPSPGNPGGKGGEVAIRSQRTIALQDRIFVSDDDTITGSSAGGSVRLASSKAKGIAVSISSSAEILALLNAGEAGPGGVIEVKSAGGDIVVEGRLIADSKGSIRIRNTGSGNKILFDGAEVSAAGGEVLVTHKGVAGLIEVLNGTNISADVVKLGALGANGVLRLAAGSRVDAVNTLMLYGGGGKFGRVEFVGPGTVDISGNPIHIAAKTVEVSAATHVNNNGPTNIHAASHKYGVGAGGGNFGNAVNAGPLSGKPKF